MSLPDSIWFHRGREARASGLPCEVRDARVSGEHRRHWMDGWREEDRLRRVLTPAQRAEAAAVTARLKEFARSL